ncbi:MAG: PilZ domain-containing protein [Oscillospiraceae bacterium]|nr:PilZ domain-containing protein [Oscillospiraceae bacterium]
MRERIYLLLNDEDVPFGRGVLLTAPELDELRVKLMDGGIDEIREHKLVTLVGTLQNMPTLQGEVMEISGNMIRLRRVDSKADVRDTLRVDVAFDSLLYPVSGTWSGRRKVEFIDLSCGGIAFFCDEAMDRGDLAEIVIPVTPQPLLMRIRILRSWERGGRTCYAARFIDMCHDEEKLICEAVFAIQLEQHGRKS